MNKPFCLIFVLIISCLRSISASTQTINPDLLVRKWKAFWIYVPNSSVNDYGVYHFRKEIKLGKKAGKFVVHVSADNRYKLFVNGELVSVGPARGDFYHWNYETVDIAPYLKEGTNVIGSTVWNGGPFRPLAQISSRTAFILQGDGKEESVLNTNSSWKCIQDAAYNPVKPEVIGFFVAPYGEFLDMNRMATGWDVPGFDDAQWQKAATISVGMPKGVNAMGACDWMLVPSGIPQMERLPQRIRKWRKAEGVRIPEGFPAQKEAFTIPAHTRAVILLDQTFNTNAYPVLQFSKGKNASVTLQYAESLYDETAQKACRNEVEGKKMIGVKDSLLANGGDNQTFIPLDWKTFRYLQLTVKTQGEPLVVEDLYAVSTGYPFKNNATFASDNPEMSKMLDIGWRTARLCAMETYMDCPYYEQLQYVGDTRIQAMVSYYNSGDDRLARQAIRAIDRSRLAEGVTQGRYPASGDNIISTFSLMWIGMLADYYHYRNDAGFVKEHLPGMRQILSFYERYMQADGTLGNLPYWTFVDWPERAKGWKMGAPPVNRKGESAVLDMLLLRAYQWAAELERDLGNEGMARHDAERAARLARSIKAKYWDESRQLFADTDEKNIFSQHANTLAILTGIVQGDEAQALFRRMLSQTDLARASIYFQYYLNRALAKVGLGNEYLEHLDVWREYMKLGMTTWGEDSKTMNTRSDCHAWGASPNIEFFRIVLGIDSDAPGFGKVKIVPHLGTLNKACGEMPHPSGTIRAGYERKGKKWLVKIELPQAVGGFLVWEGKEYQLREGENQFNF